MAVRLACGGSCGLEVLRLSGLPVGLIGNAAVKAHCMAQRQARLWHFTALRKQMPGCGLQDNMGSPRPPRPPHGTSWQLCPQTLPASPVAALYLRTKSSARLPEAIHTGQQVSLEPADSPTPKAVLLKAPGLPTRIHIPSLT